jgi:hypothetical protein
MDDKGACCDRERGRYGEHVHKNVGGAARMTIEETLMILAVLKAAYPHAFKGMTRKDGEAMAQLWLRQFETESYAEVDAAVNALIATRTAGYTPTIGEVKEQIQRIRKKDDLDELAAWALVSKACSNGIYGYKEEFAKLPPDVQRAVGAPEQLREWAQMDVETVQSVVASNFQRSYRTTVARQRDFEKLPASVQNVVLQISGNMKMLEG